MPYSKESLHRDGIMMVRTSVRQQPVTDLGELLDGEAAAKKYAEKLKDVMDYSGVTVEEARTALNNVKGDHLGEVLEALNIIEKNQHEK